jgi:hypothetical protein
MSYSGRKREMKYLIETPHTEKECAKLITWIHAQGCLYNFEWGCESGAHCGWTVVDTDGEEQVKMMVPALVRNKARIVKLNKYAGENVESLHTVE